MGQLHNYYRLLTSWGVTRTSKPLWRGVFGAVSSLQLKLAHMQGSPKEAKGNGRKADECVARGDAIPIITSINIKRIELLVQVQEHFVTPQFPYKYGVLYLKRNREWWTAFLILTICFLLELNGPRGLKLSNSEGSNLSQSDQQPCSGNSCKICSITLES